jgi:flagellar hook-associated protein 2
MKVDKNEIAIEKLEDDLDDMADRYYQKFSAMETALSKLDSQASLISQLFSS